MRTRLRRVLTSLLTSRPILAVILVLLCCTPAAADTSLPIAFVVLDTLVELHLIPAIVLIEALIAKRVLGLSAVRCLLLSAVANTASGLVGLPLTSLLVWHGLRGIGDPRTGDDALITLMLLCVPCFLVSVWTETRVARWLVPVELRPRCARWSFQANLASYAMIEGVLIVLFAAITLWRRQGLIR